LLSNGLNWCNTCRDSCRMDSGLPLPSLLFCNCFPLCIQRYGTILFPFVFIDDGSIHLVGNCQLFYFHYRRRIYCSFIPRTNFLSRLVLTSLLLSWYSDVDHFYFPACLYHARSHAHGRWFSIPSRFTFLDDYLSRRSVDSFLSMLLFVDWIIPIGWWFTCSNLYFSYTYFVFTTRHLYLVFYHPAGRHHLICDNHVYSYMPSHMEDSNYTVQVFTLSFVFQPDSATIYIVVHTTHHFLGMNPFHAYFHFTDQCLVVTALDICNFVDRLRPRWFDPHSSDHGEHRRHHHVYVL